MNVLPDLVLRKFKDLRHMFDIRLNFPSYQMFEIRDLHNDNMTPNIVVCLSKSRTICSQ